MPDDSVGEGVVQAATRVPAAGRPVDGGSGAVGQPWTPRRHTARAEESGEVRAARGQALEGSGGPAGLTPVVGVASSDHGAAAVLGASSGALDLHRAGEAVQAPDEHGETVQEAEVGGLSRRKGCAAAAVPPRSPVQRATPWPLGPPGLIRYPQDEEVAVGGVTSTPANAGCPGA